MKPEPGGEKSLLNQFLRIAAANILITLAYAAVNVPRGIINGGLTSFAMVLSRLSGVPVWLIVDIATLSLLFASLFFLGKTFFWHSLVSAVLYPGLFTLFTMLHPVLTWPLPLALLLASVTVGVGQFLCISARATTLGFDTVAMIVHSRHPRLRVAQIMFACNAAVVLMGLATYGPAAVAFGIAGSAVQAFTLDKMLQRWPQPLAEEEEADGKAVTGENGTGEDRSGMEEKEHE